MNLHFDTGLVEGYSSNSQRARILTESWVGSNMYCPVCGNPELSHFSNNMKVADFYCPSCSEQYELKSKNGKLGHKIADGAYDTFVQRITENTSPDFLFMSYDTLDMMVHQLYFVPKFFFLPSIAEKRKPLGENARRAGWVGCNILYDQIPMQGRIAIIKDAIEVDANVVKKNVKRAFDMRVDNLDSRGWMFDVLHCVNGIEAAEFTLSQMYQFTEILEAKYPSNHNVQAKIREQLQVLRDHGIIEFLGKGRYRKIGV